MLPKKLRLNRNEIRVLLDSEAQTYQSELFNIVYLPSKTGETKFGVAVSGKVSKKATERNRIRRSLFDICGRGVKDFADSYNILLFVKKNILSKSFEETEREILKGLATINSDKDS